MRKLLKTIEYKGQKYEIMMMEENGKWFLRDFKNGNPFSPYFYGIDNKVYDFSYDFIKVEAMLAHPLLDELISFAEESVHFWVENKDKIKI